MDVAQYWPIIAPYNSLSIYATAKGGRLPTEPELRLFYDKFNAGYEGGTFTEPTISMATTKNSRAKVAGIGLTTNAGRPGHHRP